MADLRATLVTPGVNSNGALSAATEAFSNLQKQMNAPFDRKLEADIRDQNRQDKLNEVNYQHGRDATMDQRYKDEKLLEQKKYNQTLAEKQANSEYLLAKTNPNSLGSSVASREYDAALNGVQDDALKNEITASLGGSKEAYLANRAKQATNEALTNTLVSGDTVYNYDNSEKDRQFKEKQLQEQIRSNQVQEKNSALQTQISQQQANLSNTIYGDKIKAEQATFAGDAADINVKTDKDGKIIKEKVTTLDKKSQDWNNLTPEQKEEFDNQFNEGLSGLKKEKEDLLKEQQDKSKTTGSLKGNISENALKKDFIDNNNKYKKEIINDSSTTYTNKENSLVGQEAKLNSEIRYAVNDDIAKQKEGELKQVQYELLKERAKYDFNSYKELDKYNRDNIDSRIKGKQAEIDTKAKSILDDINSKGSSYETKTEILSVSPQEAKQNAVNEVKRQLKISNPSMSEYELNVAAAKRGDKVEENQRQLIKESKANAIATLKISEDRVQNEYHKTSTELEALKKSQIELTKQYSSGWNNSQLLKRLSDVEKDISETESRLNLLRIANQSTK